MNQATPNPGSCLSCAKPGLEMVLPLKPTPPANALASTHAEALQAKSYPLDLVRCAACGLVQLADVVPRDELFREYKYATGAAPALVVHFGNLAREVIERLALPPGSKVVEVGSNDGTLLGAFAQRGMTVLGIDPAEELGQLARERGIPTLTAHFDSAVASKVHAEIGYCDVVLANNVLAHVASPGDALAGIRSLLRPGGYAVVEVAHLLPMALDGIYEFIYHEHMCYFSLHSLIAALQLHDLSLVDVAQVPTQGGSLRCWIRAGSWPASDAVASLLEREASAGLTDGTLLREFAARVERVNTIVSDVVGGLSARGRRIVGYGASARAVTLLAQSGVAGQIGWIVDDNPRKVGFYLPGHAIQVVDRSRLTTREADYCVLFAWNYEPDIVAATRDFAAAGGRYIVPFPHLAVR